MNFELQYLGNSILCSRKIKLDENQSTATSTSESEAKQSKFKILSFRMLQNIEKHYPYINPNTAVQLILWC